MSNTVERAHKELYQQIKRGSFKTFLRTVFDTSFQRWEGESYETWEKENSLPAILSDQLVNHERSVLIGPRGLGKTYLTIAYTLWRMIRADKKLEITYLSYNKSQADEFIRDKAKPLISNSDLMSEYLLQDQNPQARTKIEVQNPDGVHSIMKPRGILTSLRGAHCDILIGDDLLKDEKSDSVAVPSQIEEITRLFNEKVTGLVERDGEIHVIGTAIHEDDLLHRLLGQEGFVGNKVPAIRNVKIDEENMVIKEGTSCWPKRFPNVQMFNQDLRDKQLRGFKKEMLCIPEQNVDSYLPLEKLEASFGFDDADMPHPAECTLVGGHDVGKKIHPAHAIVFLLDNNGEMWEYRSRWMHNWDYTKQVDWWNDFAENFTLTKAFYDNQGQEFEGMEEQDYTPDNFEPFNAQSQRGRVASALERRVTQGDIHFRSSNKNYRQMSNVGVDLKAPETKEGHSDCFWSSALACYAAETVETLKKNLVVPDLSSNKKLRSPSKWKNI